MLALETTASWAFSVDVTVGGNTETYTNSASDRDAVTAMTMLVAWANDAGRAWTGTRTFSWEWARHAATGGALLILACSGTFSLSVGAALNLGLPAAAGVVGVVGTAPALGTWAPISRLSIRGNLRVLAAGDGCGDGAVRPGVPGTAAKNPKAEAIGTAIDAARLAAILATASNPRRCLVYQLHKDTWLTRALGEITRSSSGPMYYAFELTLAGLAL